MTSNFLQFDPSGTNALNDTDYNSSTQRSGGVVPGIASSALFNKFALQASTMAYAIGQVLSNRGYTVSDSDPSGLVDAIAASFIGITGVTTRSSNTILVDDDFGYFFNCSSTFTQTLTAAATLGAGWYCYIRNVGSGVITIDPNGSETVDGLATITLGPGNGCLLLCDGSNFVTVGRKLEYCLIQDQKSSGTNGGTFTSGAWRTRDLTTEVVDTGGICTLSSNQFTLPAGTYRIQASAPGYSCNSHQTRLQNITDGTTVAYGTSEFAPSGTGVTVRSALCYQFTISDSKIFQIQHIAQTTRSTDGFGQAGSFGNIEIYTQVEIWKVN